MGQFKGILTLGGVGILLCACAPDGDPFADKVVSYELGEGSGFGQEAIEEHVLGAPHGGGNAGSLHVVSLGRGGHIILEFTDQLAQDGPGPDLLIFENPFTNWYETGIVAVSQDGEEWAEWSCDAQNDEGMFPGCAGVELVWTHPDNQLEPTDLNEAGGDPFDLATLGLDWVRFVRITDSGLNTYDGETGGFDLDAIAVINAVHVDDL